MGCSLRIGHDLWFARKIIHLRITIRPMHEVLEENTRFFLGLLNETKVGWGGGIRWDRIGWKRLTSFFMTHFIRDTSQ